MKKYLHIVIVILLILLSSCSATRGIEDGEQLYTGLEKITYENYEKNFHFLETKEEIEAALACEPNGALLGSSYYTTPFPISLWIWNAFHNSRGGIGKWMNNSFGKQPVLISSVNPRLRSSIATTLLQNYGYFRGKVDYREVATKNPKKGKISYNVNLGPLFLIDTLIYEGFPSSADSLIRSHWDERIVKEDTPFDISNIEAERNRITTLFRNEGYYYYQNGYASYLADTIASPGRVQMKLKMADDLPQKALNKWYVGKVNIELRKQFREVLLDSTVRRNFTVHFNGKKPSIRPRVIMRDLKLRPRQAYSYDKYQESLQKMSSTGMFSMIDYTFTPRDTTEFCDTLDLTLNCVFEKPYDLVFEAYFRGKTNNQYGPSSALTLTKKNAFRGGEKLSLSLKGSYEWQLGGGNNTDDNLLNSYEYGVDLSLEMPRLLMPFLKRRRRYYTTPTTTLKVSTDIITRAKYFTRQIVSGELTYRFQKKASSTHEFSPLVLQYDYMRRKSSEFEEIMENSPYLKKSMEDHFIPMMRYIYTYNSPATKRNPIHYEITASESGNALAAIYAIGGNDWHKKDKKMFDNPFSQFIKLEASFGKTWQVTPRSSLVAHTSAGYALAYGNSSTVPYNEQFYIGGANTVRAFTARSLGPGSYQPVDRRHSYGDQTGDIRFVANLEYRFPLVSSLYGAIFLDAGNVWTRHDTNDRPGSKFKTSSVFDQLATGTGIGIRYDLSFFVIRLDWGVGLHVPYETGKKGYYNINKFSDAQAFHIAVGYPF